ncbi:phosphoadenylyl-sulfate reductase [Halovulum sp. GXIMD14793]
MKPKGHPVLHDPVSHFTSDLAPEVLNSRYETSTPEDILRDALTTFRGQIALVSSFGAESAVLLHLVAQIDPGMPVIMLETGMLFPETLEYQQRLSQQLGLTDVRLIRPDEGALKQRDPYDALRLSNPDACCDLRKVEPLERALSGFAVTITGRKRFQSGPRARMPLFELEDHGRMRINPLKDWAGPQLSQYLDQHDLPRHPLVAKGYPSIGCAPCTTKVAAGEDARAGRWRGTDKIECGIHLTPEGRLERSKPSRQLITAAGFVEDDLGPKALQVPVDRLLSEDPKDPSGPLVALLEATSDPIALQPWFEQLDMIVIPFASSDDGRGFSLARQLRQLGYWRRLRASGHILVDQFRAAMRIGFDEVEISAEQAARNPEAQWLAVPLIDSYQRRVVAA